MTGIKKQDLLPYLPDYRQKILVLYNQGNCFRKMYDKYHQADFNIYKIEGGSQLTTDEHLNELRIKKMHQKDQLYRMLHL